MYRKSIKRILDFSISLLLLIVLMPAFLVFYLLTFIFMGKPAMFTQDRVGLNNKTFKLYKFRSMKIKSSENDVDYKRITPFGRFLRVTRVDEIPQFWNIIKGDMSFVGPRPLLPDYLSFYTEFEIQRHNVRPGLTGLSQVSGSYPTWEEQFENDIKYVNGLTLRMDVVVLIKTFKKVLFPTQKLISGKQGRVRFDLYRNTSIN